MFETERRTQRPVSPPWKVRARPCPFYSSGRCLFSDSCNFRHVIKSPLTPLALERPLSFQIPKEEETTEPYNILDDGEYDDESPADWSKEIRANLPAINNNPAHSRGPSTSSFANTVSSTETGTVRGRPVHVEQDDPYDDEADLTVYGLGLTNLHDEQQDYSKDFAPQSPEDPSTLRPKRTSSRSIPQQVPEMSPYDSPSTPFVFPPRAPTSAGSRRTSTVDQHHRSVSRASSYVQEVEVASDSLHTHSEINLETPNASSLIKSRRKATVSAWVDQVDSTPQAVIPGSPTITLKSLGRNTQPVDETGMLISSPSPQFLETPPIDYDMESPSIARQRFHRAYKLVTDELRTRVAHLRKSPITPEMAQAPTNPPPRQQQAPAVLSPITHSRKSSVVPKRLVSPTNQSPSPAVAIFSPIAHSRKSSVVPKSLVSPTNQPSSSSSSAAAAIVSPSAHMRRSSTAPEPFVPSANKSSSLDAAIVSPIAHPRKSSTVPEPFVLPNDPPPVTNIGSPVNELEPPLRTSIDEEDPVVEQQSETSASLTPDAKDYQESDPGSRPWLKPFRLSTLITSPGLPSSPFQPSRCPPGSMAMKGLTLLTNSTTASTTSLRR
ncbi:hypothetical protein M408DRAFT_127419 [Serendipita vermifera MAFF 305830]|uniref:C3H1-type domain-containing protein n=1 Tax=Serendipita vermifera MAFF 305830 TaxID=933852 RepID=A0A0C3AWZ8_SERVB|nr:hypothetical protein M408DRAFT_127419 [Serendipita vermifera MAFF 305830]